MKSMTCEMCGNNDLVKQDGYFVCQYCGTKYTVEEAKKLMVEGTVKIDNSDFVEKYLQNARRAKQKEDWEEAEKYYNLVEQNDPTNIEAIFYSSYGKAKISLIEEDIYKRQQVFKVLTNCVSIIDDNYDVEDSEKEEEIIKQIANDIIEIATGNFIYTQWKNGYGMVTGTNKGDTYELFNGLISAFIESVDNIIKTDNKFYLHQVKVDMIKARLNVPAVALGTDLSSTLRPIYIDQIKDEYKIMKEMDPSFVEPSLPAATASPAASVTANSDGVGCGAVLTVLSLIATIISVIVILFI